VKQFLCGILLLVVLVGYVYGVVSFIGTGLLCWALVVVGGLAIVVGLSDLHLKI
jgi:hypothetical protein